MAMVTFCLWFMVFSTIKLINCKSLYIMENSLKHELMPKLIHNDFSTPNIDEVIMHDKPKKLNSNSGKRRRCLCKKLRQRVQELEKKLNLLLAASGNVHYIKGPKGDKGDRGPAGPPGPKGDRGFMGLSGRDGKDGYPISKLPRCKPGEYISSDGNDLFCMKLGKYISPQPVATTSPPLLTTFKPIDPKGRLESPPTVTAEIQKKIAKFKKKYPIQTLYADTWDLHSFIWRENSFLGISQLSRNTFTLYKWMGNIGFVEKAYLTIANARKWTSVEWMGAMYIIIACNTRGTNNKPGLSYIYKITKDDTVELFQRVNTTTAFAVDTIIKDGQLFVIFLSLFGRSSRVYKWGRRKFEHHQDIPVLGTGLDAFHIGSRTMIAAVGTTSRGPYVYLLEYRAGKFHSHKEIPVETRPYGVRHVKIGKEHFLGVARYDMARSVILKWNGESFEEMQQIDSCKARDFSSMTTHQMNRDITYLAVINYDCKPVIYVYDEKTKKFLKLQQTDSERTRDIEFLKMSRNDKIFLAVSSNKQTEIYAGSTS